MICISTWLKQLLQGAQQQQQQQQSTTTTTPIYVNFNSIPIADDQRGRDLIGILNNLVGLESVYRNYLHVRVPPLVHSSHLTTPSTDIYLTPDAERTMFGLGFVAVDKYVAQRKQQYMDLIDWTVEDSWITLDYNTPSISNDLILKAFASKMNVYVMDHCLHESVTGLLPNTGSAFFYQTSTDWMGKKGDIEMTLGVARDWLSKYPNTFIIITDGANGLAAGGCFKRGVNHQATYIAPFWHYALPTMQQEHCKDTIGAGDAFRAGMLFSILQDQSMSQCLNFASAAGALNTRYYGGCSRVPDLSEVLQMLQDNN
ncbi:hypothetical protein SAMD00019534_045770, partial [Acytostelium subglobosum LB1]|uniref:hypothetical protein n=1 Tax=Acytostelium subglobosum LB1 TaxID=1410327 RepID=UPI000644986F